MRTVHYLALILVIIGALNWGLVGLFEYDLVAAIFGGQDAAMSRIVYCLVGLSGLVLAATSMTPYGVPRDAPARSDAMRSAH
jgi:uncharacterized protein